MEADLLAWGKTITPRDHRTPQRASTAVTIGFVEQEHGVAARGGQLDARTGPPTCRPEPHAPWSSRHRRRVPAIPLDEPAAGRGRSGLILKYGTPAERLGAGPAFRLDPAG